MLNNVVDLCDPQKQAAVGATRWVAHLNPDRRNAARCVPVLQDVYTQARVGTWRAMSVLKISRHFANSRGCGDLTRNIYIPRWIAHL